jgi:hypothetical protein
MSTWVTYAASKPPYSSRKLWTVHLGPDFAHLSIEGHCRPHRHKEVRKLVELTMFLIALVVTLSLLVALVRELTR